MSDYDCKQLVGDLYHGIRSEAKKAKRSNTEGVQRAVRGMYDKKPERYSNIPPGWDGKEWGE